MRRLVLLLAALTAPALAQTPDRLGDPEATLGPEAVATSSVAAAPASFAFQGVLDDGGQPVADGTYSVTVRLFGVVSGGTALYAEAHSVATEAGAFSLSVGGGTPASGSFASVNFSEAVWVEVVWDGTTLAPRTQVEPTPVAHALPAGTLLTGNVTNAMLQVQNFSSSGRGLSGWTRSTTGTTYGVYGRTESGSFNGTGVVGYAASNSGSTHGVWGLTDSPDGRGVHGEATNFGTNAYGVSGESRSGRGVYGFTTSASGFNYGVWGESPSTSGNGVRGVASASSGTTYGVYGESASTSGRGVYGRAEASSGINYGVYGVSVSTGGIGVYGSSTAQTGTNYGGQFRNASTGGRGVYGEATAATGLTNGVRGFAASTEGRGVHGRVSATSGVTYGVFGESLSPDGRGVYGIAPQFGVHGVGSLGAGWSYGVFGESGSTTGRGVLGKATATTGVTYGVVGQTESQSGRGVYGFATAGSGQNVGVYGQVASSAGLAGYFEKSYGGPEVVLTDPTDHVVHIRNTSGGQSADVLALSTGVLGNPGVWSSFASFYDGDGDLLGQIRGNRDGGVLYTTYGADYAEYLPLAPAASVQPGDLVGVQGGHVSLATEAAEQVMIVASNAAVAGNMGQEEAGALVSFVGQAEVRLSGPAAVGDLLVASGLNDGTARAVAPSAYRPEADGPVAGRVLSLPVAGRAVALVGVDEAAALRAVVVRQAAAMDRQDDELNALLDQVRTLTDALDAERSRSEMQDRRLARLESLLSVVADGEGDRAAGDS